MKKKQDPNEEVECWEDAFYEKIKGLSGEQLTKYLEDTSKQIQKKYNIEPPYTVKSS